MTKRTGYLWGTRGKTWGFRFLERGGLDNPLPLYEDMFAAIDDQPRAFCRVGEKVALRFPDPEDRRDASGRVIPHHFVLFGDEADGVDSFEDGFAKVWPKVAASFDAVWELDEPPAP